MSGNFKNILSILTILTVMVGAYYVINNVDLFINYADRAQAIEQKTIQLENDIIKPLDRLSAVQINKVFFSTDEFMSLSEKGAPIRTPALERPNPFNPIN